MNDLLLLKKCTSYNNRFGEISIKKCINHLLYLNEEVTILRLTTELIMQVVKKSIRRKKITKL